MYATKVVVMYAMTRLNQWIKICLNQKFAKPCDREQSCWPSFMALLTAKFCGWFIQVLHAPHTTKQLLATQCPNCLILVVHVWLIPCCTLYTMISDHNKIIVFLFFRNCIFFFITLCAKMRLLRMSLKVMYFFLTKNTMSTDIH